MSIPDHQGPCQHCTDVQVDDLGQLGGHRCPPARDFRGLGVLPCSAESPEQNDYESHD